MAEKALTMIYEAKDIIEQARSPASFQGEGTSRPRREGETESQASHRDALYAPAERLLNQREFFMALNAFRYRLVALFGWDAAAPVETIFRARAKVLSAARMLTSFPDHAPAPPDLRQRLERDIWSIGDKDDLIKHEVDEAVAKLESICRPALTEEPRPPIWRVSLAWWRSRFG